MGNKDFMSPAEYVAMMEKERKDKEKQKKSKYKNNWAQVDGFKFQSEKEATYYGTEKMKKAAGDIVDFKMQVVYKLEVNGVLVCKYIADFVEYHKGSGITVVDVKSPTTRANSKYVIKRKLMLAIHGIKIKEV